MNTNKLETYDITIFRKYIPKSGNLLGLDLGEKRIGISISNKERTIAVALTTLTRGKIIEDINYLQNIIYDNDITGIVIGLPLNHKGKTGKKAQSIRRLSEEINKILKMPLLYWDERYSSKAINNTSKIIKNNSKKSLQPIDKYSATWILEGAIKLINLSN